jgi:hypothetical protein
MLLSTSCFGQTNLTVHCLFDPNRVSDGITISAPRTSDCTGGCTLQGCTPDEMQHVPICTVLLSFRFIEQVEDGSIITDGITEDEILKMDPDFIKNYAKAIIDQLNNRVANNVPNVSSLGFPESYIDENNWPLPDTRLRFELRGDGGPNDNNTNVMIAEGVYLYKFTQIGTTPNFIAPAMPVLLGGWGAPTLNVRFGPTNGNSPNSCQTGAVGGTGLANLIDIFNFSNCTLDPIDNLQVEAYHLSGVIYHEFGHTVGGLCHAFSTGNVCGYLVGAGTPPGSLNPPQFGRDINIDFECDPIEIGNQFNLGCGTNNTNADCEYNLASNNFMAYVDGQNSMTPCQWIEIFQRIVQEDAQFVRWQLDYNPDPLILSNSAGGTVTWDNMKILGRNVIVETGVTLRITCDVYLGPNRSITVQNGARLLIEGGSLRKLATDFDNNPPNDRWDAVHLIGNPYYPHLLTMTDPDPNLIPQPKWPAIAILNNACIEDSKEGFHFEYGRNGLLIAENSTFFDNRRSASFMSTRTIDDQNTINTNDDVVVDFPAYNRILNCRFERIDGIAKYGITNWDANNVVIDNCSFIGLTTSAVHTIDGSFTITDSEFHSPSQNNAYAVVLEATSLNLGRTTTFGGDATILPPVGFNPNNLVRGFYGGLITRGYPSLVAENNLFDNNFLSFLENGAVSDLQLMNNEFRNIQYGQLYQHATGDGYSLINSNLFVKGPGTGLASCLLTGLNEQTYYECNQFDGDYNNSAQPDIFLIASSSTTSATSLNNQGTTTGAIRNFFHASPGNICTRIKTSGQTDLFNYYFPEGAANSPDPQVERQAPKCDYDSPILGVFNRFFAFEGNANPCDVIGLGGLLGGGTGTHNRCETVTCFSDRQRQITAMRDSVIVGIASASTANRLENAMNDFYADLHHLMRLAVLDSNSLTADLILDAVTIVPTDRYRISNTLAEGRFDEAEQLINDMHTQVTDDYYFREVQRINMYRLKDIKNFVLTTNQKQTLYQVAESQEPSRGYAQSLLGLLEDKDFGLELPDMSTQHLVVAENTSKITLAPNPSRGVLFVTLSQEIDIANGSLYILDVLGNTLLQLDNITEPKATFDLTSLQNGFYIVVFKRQNGLTSSEPFLLQH